MSYLNDTQIKHMVERFLNWRLPENFNPDGGINFERYGNKDTPHQYTNEPSGTNLLDAVQAEAMVRYMVDGLHAEPAAPSGSALSGIGADELVRERAVRAAALEEATFWVIERHILNKLHYWNAGQSSEGARSDSECGGWTTSVHDAVQFAREQDAMVVLFRLLNGQGRVAEHGMIRALAEPQRGGDGGK